MVATNVLAVRWWWLEEGQLVLACRLVKTAMVCQSVGSSSHTEDFQRNLRVLTCCVGFLCL